MIYKVLLVLILYVSIAFGDTLLEERNIANKKAEEFYKNKDYIRAIDDLNRSIIIEKKLFGVNSIEISLTYRNMGQSYNKLYQNKEALKYYKKEFEILKQLKPNSIGLAKNYHRTAIVYKFFGDYKKALEYNQKSLTIKESKPKKGIKEQKSISFTYNNIAEIYRATGKYVKSLENYNLSLAIQERIFNQNNKHLSNIYSNLGGLYHTVGDYIKALEYHNKALKIRKIKNYKIYQSYHNIARIYQKLKEYQKSLKFYKSSLENNLNDKVYRAETYNNMAEIYLELDNKHKLSLEFVNKSKKINIELFGENHLNCAINYTTLALIHQKNKDYNKSLDYYNKALKIRLAHLGKDNIDTAKSYYQISEVYNKQEDYNNSLMNVKKAFDIFLINQKENYLILDNSQKKSYNKHYNSSLVLSSLFNISYKYSKKSPKDSKSIAKDNFQRWLNYKGTISNRENSISIIYHKINKLKQNIETLKEKKIYLSTLYQTYRLKETIKEINARNKELKIIKDEISILEIALNQTNKIFAELLRLKDINFLDISSHLKENHLYIDFARALDNYYIFTIDWKNNITFDMLSEGETIRLEDNIAKFRGINKEMAKKDKNLKELEKSTKEILNIIYKILNKYLPLKSNKKDYLIISPDGLLNFLPFEALFYDNKYMIEDKTITYIPSAKELVRGFYREKIDNKLAKVVVFTHPDYDLASTKKRKKIEDSAKTVKVTTNHLNFSEYFKDLKGSLYELDVLKNFYKNIEIYQDKNATVTNLLNIKNPKILHISTHAFFIKNSSVNFMQQSGLALAGANNVRLISDTYGIATALKLSNLELVETQLVVLSACDTGVGKIEFAEGVAGLSKAFIQAGAKNIMMSLWSVDDKQTANLMEKFYINLDNKKDNYIDSLRKAKLQMIKLHPYYWSSFVINGV